MDEFLRALDWAHHEMWKMYIREIKYRTTADDRREPVISEWYSFTASDGKLCWRDPAASEIIIMQDKSVTLTRAMRFRIDLKEGKGDVRDGKGLYLQIRIEIPDRL